MKLAGVAEVAQLLGITKQRASQLESDPLFPKPLAHLAAGPVWDAAEVLEFATLPTVKHGRGIRRVPRDSV